MTSQWHAYVKNQIPLRVLVIVHRNSPLFELSDNIDAIRDCTLTSLGASVENSNNLSLSTWPSRTVMVFDLCNKEYNFQKAHEPEDLPVLIVHYCTAQRIKISIAATAEKLEINQKVAESHKYHGFKALPMVDDHRNNNIPTYMDPRI
ncbi:uncharacterized protein EKO05_0000689 [Ascochyta rabiei]|uniref:uncharacterized protein n=1 Tax=Didymella rabiei TaxID=5454 RepID=UPI0022041BEE|nr:uncharacterized protein EKO05_0000689 [Ascochyta rabiei]UPX10013.1 hypothetical protein EKO05_0000689 [Ascochyta rabiei]